MRLTKSKIIGLTMGTLFSATALSASATEVNGIWFTPEKEVKIEIYDCGANKCGTIVWLEEPNDENGNPKKDIHNEDPEKRDNLLIGTEIIWDMEPKGENKWGSGRIHKADDGDVYRSRMELKGPDLLDVKGCIAFICVGMEWTRTTL